MMLDRPIPTPGPIRALEVLRALPAGHWLLLQRSGMHEPHLKRGELAVVAPGATFAPGELHVLAQADGPKIWALSPVNDPRAQGYGSDEPLIEIHTLWRPRVNSDGSLDLRGPLYASEGAGRAEAVQARIIGLVVGIYAGRPPLMAPVETAMDGPAWQRERQRCEWAERRGEP